MKIQQKKLEKYYQELNDWFNDFGKIWEFVTYWNDQFLKSECLKEIISEIDTSNEIIEIIISTEKQFIRFSSFGLIGDTHVYEYIYFQI